MPPDQADADSGTAPDDDISAALPRPFWRQLRFQVGFVAVLVLVLGGGAWIAKRKNQGAAENTPLQGMPDVAAQRRAEEAERQRNLERETLKEAVRTNDEWGACRSIRRRAGDEARDACRALVRIAHNGRSNAEDQQALRKYLKGQGYKKIAGYIIARHDDGLYEAAYLQDSYFGPMPKGRFILQTNMTDYSSKGRFALSAVERDRREITTTSGFVQSWKVFEETPFGSAVEMVFRAPAGNETSEAAVATLEALTIQ